MDLQVPCFHFPWKSLVTVGRPKRSFKTYLQCFGENPKRTLPRKVNLVVGGAFGLSDDVAENASKTISFSDMEFSHEVFRVMLLEQVYRANCIFNNHPYHQS